MKRIIAFFLVVQGWLLLSCGSNFYFDTETMNLVGSPTSPAKEIITSPSYSNSYIFPGTEPFTIIALPDTQKYSQKYPQIFEAQVRWIIDNQDALNIVYVFHLGDIVADHGNPEEWMNASRAMSLLDAIIPYGVLPGNHDMDRNGVADNYNKYFPVTKFEKESWWGGNYLGNKNNYQLVSVSNVNFIMLNLEYEPSRDVLSWARDVLATHPNRIAILATHSYLRDGSLYAGPLLNWRSNGTHSAAIQAEVVATSKNMLMVLSGHSFEEASFRTSQNGSGKPVFEMMSDYQSMGQGGSGYLRIIRFLPKEQKISVQTYSPWIDSYQRGEEDEFEICLSFGMRCSHEK